MLDDGDRRLVVKGAPEQVMANCTTVPAAPDDRDSPDNNGGSGGATSTRTVVDGGDTPAWIPSSGSSRPDTTQR